MEQSCRFDLNEHDMGFGDSIDGDKDPVLLEAAKILKLIHIENLRELQSRLAIFLEIFVRKKFTAFSLSIFQHQQHH